MSRGQRTNKDLQKSSSKSELSVLENLFHTTLAKLDTTLISQFVFSDPKYFVFLLLTFSALSEGYCRNAYVMWGFWCDSSLF
jgi:hypothetical protein